MDDGVTFNAVTLQLLLEDPPHPAQANKAAESRKRANNISGNILSANMTDPAPFFFSILVLAVVR